ncbi:septum formation family protein [Nocardioides sp. Kera G14]|uniref:septum formation family protein n=1 Tax=Nocardioides sp. Kera G14 TaxID=2884264 RepID=UPI001D0FAB21|nr:septum formation family protein [Nocardioides sp. Kera G14]UDY24844.1 septum formation family protein [Nocardioides sp. Kera G14]
MIRAALALLVLSLLAACGSSEAPVAKPTPPPTATAAPLPPASACYVLTYAQAVAPTADATKTPVPCSKPHTSETFYVGALSSVVGGHLVAVDSARIQRQSARTCPARLSAYVGGSTDDLRLSMVRAVWFTPTVDESDTGADWLRCDVIAVAGAERLASITGSLKDSLAKGAGREAMCGTAAPGEAGFDRVPCAQKHSWKAIRVVPFPGDDYPGETAVKAAGQGPCQAAGKDVASDPLTYRWSYEFPTQAQWDNGQTYGLCWAPDPA